MVSKEALQQFLDELIILYSVCNKLSHKPLENRIYFNGKAAGVSQAIEGLRKILKHSEPLGSE